MNEDQLHRLAVTQNSDSVGSLANQVSDAGQNPDTKRSTGDVFREMGKGFLDSLNGTLLTPLVRPLQIAANTPGWQAIQDKRAILANQRKQSDLETANANVHETNKQTLESLAIEEGQLNNTSRRLANETALAKQQEWQEQAPGRAELFSNEVKLSSLKTEAALRSQAAQRFAEVNMQNQLLHGRSFNELVKNAGLKDKDSIEDLKNSQEFAELCALQNCISLIPKARQEIMQGAPGVNCDAIRYFLEGQGYNTYVNDVGDIMVEPNNGSRKPQEFSAFMKTFQDELVKNSEDKIRNLQFVDSGSNAGGFFGVAKQNMVSSFINIGMSRQEAISATKAQLETMTDSHKRDICLTRMAYRSLSDNFVKGTGLTQAKMASLPVPQLLEFSDIQSTLKDFGVYVDVDPETTQYMATDTTGYFAPKGTKMTLDELDQAMKAQDTYGEQFAAQIVNLQNERQLVLMKAANAILKGKGNSAGQSIGEEESTENGANSVEVTPEVKVNMSRKTGGKSDEWTNETRKNYLDANNETLHDALIDGFAVATKGKNEKGEDVINYQLDTDKLSDIKNYIALRNLVTRDEARLKRGALGKENLQSEYRPYLTAMQHEIDDKIHATRLKKERHGRLLAIRNLMKGIDLPVEWKGKDLKSRQTDIDVVRQLSREGAKGLKLYDKSLEPLYKLKESAPEKFKQLCKVTRELYDSELRLNANVTEQEREQFIENLSD